MKHQTGNMSGSIHHWYWLVGHVPAPTGGVVPKEQVPHIRSKSYIGWEFVMRLPGSKTQIDLDWSLEVGQEAVGYIAECHRLPLLMIRGIDMVVGVGPPHLQPIAARLPAADLNLPHSMTRS